MYLSNSWSRGQIYECPGNLRAHTNCSTRREREGKPLGGGGKKGERRIGGGGFAILTKNRRTQYACISSVYIQVLESRNAEKRKPTEGGGLNPGGATVLGYLMTRGRRSKEPEGKSREGKTDKKKEERRKEQNASRRRTMGGEESMFREGFQAEKTGGRTGSNRPWGKTGLARVRAAPRAGAWGGKTGGQGKRGES